MRTDPTPATSRLAAFLIFLLATSCGSSEDEGSPAPAPAPADDRASPPVAAESDAAAAEAPTAPTAKVLEAMDAAGYTYVQLDVDGEATWFAGPKTSLAPGDSVFVPANPLPMKGFSSEALGRTFDVVYFVDSIRKVGESEFDPARAVEQAHGAAKMLEGSKPSVAEAELTGIAKAEGGLTVAEVFALGKDGAGQDVVLRAKVVKYNANILDKNWLHVRDGTGAEGENDIIVTTGDVAAVGDTVLVRGKLAADRDLGFGYKFDLLIEDAKVTVE